MTNNEKLIKIQKLFKLKASQLLEICLTSSEYTVYGWRSNPSTERYRAMPDSKYKLLVYWLVANQKVKDEQELNALIDSE